MILQFPQWTLLCLQFRRLPLRQFPKKNLELGQAVTNWSVDVWWFQPRKAFNYVNITIQLIKSQRCTWNHLAVCMYVTCIFYSEISMTQRHICIIFLKHLENTFLKIWSLPLCQPIIPLLPPATEGVSAGKCPSFAAGASKDASAGRLWAGQSPKSRHNSEILAERMVLCSSYGLRGCHLLRSFYEANCQPPPSKNDGSPSDGRHARDTWHD